MEHAQGTNTSDLAAKKDFVALKVEVGKPNINKLFNVPTSLTNLKTEINELEVGELKNCS